MQNPCSFAVGGGQSFKKTCSLVVRGGQGFTRNLAVLLLEGDKGLQTPCMSFVVGRGQGFTQNLAVLIGLTGWVKAGRVAGRSGKRLEE